MKPGSIIKIRRPAFYKHGSLTPIRSLSLYNTEILNVDQMNKKVECTGEMNYDDLGLIIAIERGEDGYDRALILTSKNQLGWRVLEDFLDA